jgi:hypothetical protein
LKAQSEWAPLLLELVTPDFVATVARTTNPHVWRWSVNSRKQILRGPTYKGSNVYNAQARGKSPSREEAVQAAESALRLLGRKGT